MKKYFNLIIFAITIAAHSTFAQQCPNITLPSSFTAEEEFFTFGTDYVFSSRGSRIANIEERVLNWTTTFELYNANHEKVATAREQFFTWGTTIDIFDCNNTKIATIREELFTSLLGTYSRFHILNNQGREIGLSEKEELFTTDFYITSTSGGSIRMHRPAFSLFTHNWSVRVSGSAVQNLDSRVVLFIPAFKTSGDRHYESSN